jgi:hypothetical protein
MKVNDIRMIRNLWSNIQQVDRPTSTKGIYGTTAHLQSVRDITWMPPYKRFSKDG